MAYRTFRDTGRAPTTTELVTSMGLPLEMIRHGLRQLAGQRHLVQDGERIVMAHPFSAIPLGFSVMGRDTLWHLARTWYDGRLDRGYQRREPADAVAYLRSVGLAGPLGAVMTGRAHRRG